MHVQIKHFPAHLQDLIPTLAGIRYTAKSCSQVFVMPTKLTTNSMILKCFPSIILLLKVYCLIETS